MKIVVVNIYFGSAPGFIELFLKACGKNPAIDFLFFVDFKAPVDLPANVRFVQSNLDEMRARFQKNFDFPITLNSAYKLCDYRPAFGSLFADYFVDYDWWGHCDFDMVFGDLTPVVTVAKSNEYVKIFRRGHLSLYRNVAEINNVYKSELGPLDYRKVFSTDKFCLFDETNGIDKTFTLLGLPVFREEWVADVTPKSAFLSMTAHANSLGQYFIWTNGKIKCVSLSGNEREFIYIHLQKRQMAERHLSLPEADAGVLISQFGLFNLSSGYVSRVIRNGCLIPNLWHLKRFYLPRVIRSLRRKLTS